MSRRDSHGDSTLLLARGDRAKFGTRFTPSIEHLRKQREYSSASRRPVQQLPECGADACLLRLQRSELLQPLPAPPLLLRAWAVVLPC